MRCDEWLAIPKSEAREFDGLQRRMLRNGDGFHLDVQLDF